MLLASTGSLWRGEQMPQWLLGLVSNCVHVVMHGVARIMRTDTAWHACVCAHANAHFSAVSGVLGLILGMP